MHQTFVAGDYLACRRVYHWRCKVCIVDAFSVCRWYEFLWREGSWNGTRASCNVIAVSALWLINRALARVPPPSILYGGMIITGDVLSLTLLDWRVFFGVGRSGCINANSVLIILGRAPSVLFRDCRRCMRAVVIKLHFAVGSRVCMIAGAFEIRGLVQMCVGLSITSSLATLCSSSFGGASARMALIAFARLLMSYRPLVVPAAISVAVCNFEMCNWAQDRDLAVLWEEFSRSRNSVCSCLRYEVQIAPIVVSQRP
jgi:hypothetical protein